MKQHVIKICQTAYCELKCISPICRYLTEDASKQLVNARVLFRSDYCNSPSIGTPNLYLTDAESPEYCCMPYYQSTTPSKLHIFLQQITWLPISERMKYKTACVCYNTITGFAPTYPSELLYLYSSSRYLCSSSDTHMLKLQRFSCKTMAFTPFLHFSPRIWNNPIHRHSATLSSLKGKLKVFLFSKYLRWATLSFTHIGLCNAHARACVRSCVRVCVYVYILAIRHSYISTLVDVYIMC